MRILRAVVRNLRIPSDRHSRLQYACLPLSRLGGRVIAAPQLSHCTVFGISLV